MMSVQELIQSGNLAEAISVATADIKRQPMRPELRVVMAELMCLTGDLDRADTLIESATKLYGGPAPGLILLRQLLRGEMARKQWFEEGRPPQSRLLPSPELATALQSVVEYRAGHPESAVSLVGTLAQSDTRKGVIQKPSGEEHFSAGFRDLNDLTASVAELISASGAFFWVPWGEIVKVKFQPVKTLRDLIWRPLECTFTDGALERYFMPCLYAGTARAKADAVRLGQETDWVDLGAGLISGIGQRMFLADDSTPSILEFNDIEFESIGSDHGESR